MVRKRSCPAVSHCGPSNSQSASVHPPRGQLPAAAFHSPPGQRRARNGTHDLQLDSLALQLDGPDLEINSNGADVGFGVGVVREPEEETRLADTRVTNEEELVAGVARG